ncbi:Nectin-2 [Merluccius polli]|uniref:Nectin-2 n=1 Tax=Merluccius polli TaxID=89951 RepID=A0AA47P421_MERPO|nr:Nectin-2 [Merluccius polli]
MAPFSTMELPLPTVAAALNKRRVYIPIPITFLYPLPMISLRRVKGYTGGEETSWALGQRVKVEPEVLSYPGQSVNLRCAFNDPSGIQLTQVTWIYEPKVGRSSNIAVYHPNFGAHFPEDTPQNGRVTFTTDPPSLPNPSIQISDVKMSDEGKYICEFATYPSGNELGVTSLIMLAKPQNKASTVTAVAGTKPVVVAKCESANGRPESKISWVTTASGNGTTVTKTGADNTVTVSSDYIMVPTAADNGKDISCVVTHRTQATPESFKMKLAVEYLPIVTIVGYDNNWYIGRTNVELNCQATGNPIPTTVTWKTLTGELPDTVVIKENKLTVLKVDDAVNTTFICEVKNRLGIGKEQVTALVRAPASGASCRRVEGMRAATSSRCVLQAGSGVEADSSGALFGPAGPRSGSGVGLR